jgi:RND family efflux transporter MFP subunit
MQLYKALGLSSIAAMFFSCSSDQSYIQPETQHIATFVYASGIVKSKNQYTVYPRVTGTIEEIHAREGDSVKRGQLILTLSNEVARLQQNNAALAYENSAIRNNQSRIDELKLAAANAYEKYLLDSLLFIKQQKLYDQQIGSAIELEQRKVAFVSSKSTWQTAELRYRDQLRQLKFGAEQSQNNLRISEKQSADFEIKSEINGRVYQLPKRKGELVTPQTPVAIIGDAGRFVIEIQVDEFDIAKIDLGRTVYVHMDSYKDQVFTARITRIIPIMNERTKSFTVEAEFDDAPSILYPNLTVEANILIDEKPQALVIPVAYLTDSNTVKLLSGEWVKVVTGLRNFEKVEILSGIDAQAKLIKP